MTEVRSAVMTEYCPDSRRGWVELIILIVEERPKDGQPFSLSTRTDLCARQGSRGSSNASDATCLA